MDEDEENEEYVVCSNCGEVFSKGYKYCPYCGRRVFNPHTTPLLLISAGIYFLNAVLLFISFSPYLLFTAMLELTVAILLGLGVKYAGYLGLMLSILNTIFSIYFLAQSQNLTIVIILIITHVIGAYLIIHEWENLT
ncbi:MAG: hypothetical protein ACPLVJ_03510 [Candidatus Bathyarchaeales archaeon]